MVHMQDPYPINTSMLLKGKTLGIWGHHTSLIFERSNIVENWYGVPGFGAFYGRIAWCSVYKK